MQLLRFIQLTRPVNLFIIAATLVCVNFWLINPLLEMSGQGAEKLDSISFIVLLLSTVMIAAGGYIINDYFDLKTDRINKPEKILIGKYIKRRVAMLVHVVLNTAAVGAGVWLSWKHHTLWPLIIHLSSTTLLWFYSLYFKRKFLSGNLLIAFLAWLTPMLPALMIFDSVPKDSIPMDCMKLPLFHQETCTTTGLNQYMMMLVLAFACFAFITNFIREIIKDMADVQGDREIGCTTLPIVLGIERVKILLYVLSVSLMVSVAIIAGMFFTDILPLLFAGFGVFIPLFLSVITLYRSKSRNGFLAAGNFLKFAMLSGLCLTYFVYKTLV
jgi:4-hydroxybenzoate polyprenyltransferase